MSKEDEIRRVHCWADGEDEHGNRYTCLREDGHDGGHEWTPDEHIRIRFAPEPWGDTTGNSPDE